MLFEDFELNKYMNESPPSDSSFTTMQEIKELNRIPIDKAFVEKYDDMGKVFVDIVGYDDLIPLLVNGSVESILKIKKHHNRPRPKQVADSFNIQLDYEFLPSMDTPSYPSGHSAQATLVANVLSDKYPKLRNELQQAARLTSYSRNVAHEHYKSDSTFGIEIGNDMYEHLKEKNYI
jgi:hypothetical protein